MPFQNQILPETFKILEYDYVRSNVATIFQFTKIAITKKYNSSLIFNQSRYIVCLATRFFFKLNSKILLLKHNKCSRDIIGEYEWLMITGKYTNTDDYNCKQIVAMCWYQ